MEKQIKKVLKENVDPVLAEHYGGASLSKLEDGVAFVRLTGTCASCPAAQQTLEEVVKDMIMEHVQGVKDVVLDTSVSEDLLDMAKKILRKNK